MNFALEDEEDVSQLGLDIAFGAGYDIKDNFFVDARYGLEVTNRYTGPGSEDIKGTYNTLMIGLGYKFYCWRQLKAEDSSAFFVALF